MMEKQGFTKKKQYDIKITSLFSQQIIECQSPSLIENRVDWRNMSDSIHNRPGT